ncbi:DRIM (Down-regulated in metastasis)-like proteins [Plasmopara halstedii]|uniref:DRIM (Down-regulated in metastasis)-like proteins n=1 Tax=Plasmopara halstedii TaxID=4781 RepID=A0A0P1ARA2_PLAHL|nr:DRIM (Down-regulated in metastasis)-like proteins [Plasmopara halstedii]CEG43767.1 DRIM (Down-regulated in metastasis)-like proteins [Plasmopara halstedii]|eukprot:XP_024580136.1 DRIM (Down-regulated in metastasis)-like proteins [Plasmopara halstedii]
MAAPPTKKRRHRFQKVAERVCNLQHELTLHAKMTGATDEASQLSFKEELDLQAELTTIESFQLLFRSLQPLVITTPQLLHHLQSIVKRLQKEMNEARDNAQDPVVQRQRLVPVLKLVTALARELGKEFYPHFADTLPMIVAVIDTKDPELSTQVFKTLTMLFSYLRAQVLADMDAVHKCYFPLLGHPREFVRNFAAQTLAVLLRRLESPKALKKYLRTYLTALMKGSGCSNEILRNGSAKLLFALMKNVKNGFHSRMRDVFFFLLRSFRPQEETMKYFEQQEALFEIVYQTFGLMLQHTDADHSGEILECLVSVCTKEINCRHETDLTPTEADDLYISRILRILLDFMISRTGKLITGASDAYDVRVPSVHKVCDTLIAPENKILASQCSTLSDVHLQIFEVIWRLFPPNDDVLFAQIEAIFAASNDNEKQAYWRPKLLEFVIRQLHNTNIDVRFIIKYLLHSTLKYALKILEGTEVTAFCSLVCELGAYIAKNAGDICEGQNKNIVRSKTANCVWLLSFDPIDVYAEDILFDAGRKLFRDSSETQDTESLAVCWKFCKALQFIRTNEEKLVAFATLIIQKLDEILKIGFSVHIVTLRAELWKLQQIAQHQASKNSVMTSSYAKQALQENGCSFTTFSTLLTLAEMTQEGEQYEELTIDALICEADSFFATLRSPAHQLRLVTLQLLAKFKRLDFLDSGKEGLSGPCDLLETCVSLELSCGSISVATEREVIRLLTRVKVLCRSPQTPKAYKKIAINHLLGLYHVKFSAIWPHIAEAVETAVRLHFNDFWPYIRAELLKASLRHENACEKRESSSASDVVKNFEYACMLEEGKSLNTDATDAATHHSLLWKGLVKFSDQVEAKTKFMVPLFLTFLRDQYSTIYTDELNAKRLEAIDQALRKLGEFEGNNDSTLLDWHRRVEFHDLTTKEVRGKFVDHLKLFAAFHNMKGAYSQQLLHDLFFDLLLKSDEVVSKLALQCLYAFGSKAIVPYKIHLNRLIDVSTLREELANFKIGKDESIVLREHRSELLPVLLRVLYSKCVSKKGRSNGDTVAARRAAILAYLAALDASELASFVELVVRAFDMAIDGPTSALVATEVRPVVAISIVQPSRILGFLNLLEDLLVQLGVKLAAFAPHLADVLLAILRINIVCSDVEEISGSNSIEGEDTELAAESKQDDREGVLNMDSTTTVASLRKQIRVLTYRRFAQMIDLFDSHVCLQPWVVAMLETSHDAITHLPSAVLGASKSSALLELLVTLARADRARYWISKPLMLDIISCLSAGLASSRATSTPTRGISPNILDAILQFMDSLLDGDEEVLSRQDPAQPIAVSPQENHVLLIPQIPFVLEQFVQRFQAKAARYSSDRYAGSSRKELNFLCRLSHFLEYADGDIAVAAHDLFQLLLPFLLRNHQTSMKDKENLLDVLSHIVPRLTEPKKHVLALARLLAPGANCIASRDLRLKLVAVFTALGSHATLPELAPVAKLLVELNAYDVKRIEETDVERRLIALNCLHSSCFADFKSETHLLAPLVAQCLQSMHDQDFSVRSGALASLTAFLGLSAKIAEQQATCKDISKSPILSALESLVMPCVRASLRSSDENIRRGFVTLLGSVADHCEAFQPFAFIPTDLCLVRNQKDPEADFFYNITHIQVHRRRRALQRLSGVMGLMATTKDSANVVKSEDSQSFTNSTVNGVILPLVLHFVYETHVKSQESLRAEAAACIGSAAGLLGWSHYLSLLHRLLKSINGHAEMEGAIIMAICAVIDHFHFDSSSAAIQSQSSALDNTIQADTRDITVNIGNDVEEENIYKVQDKMEMQVLPMLYSYLFKKVILKKRLNRENNEESTSISEEAFSVRVPLALAIVKVLRRLRVETFQRELPKLLLKVANLLKSKNEAVRVSARTTLIRIALELGSDFLQPIIEELRHTLRDGYMVHVLSFTVHALLENLPEIMKSDGKAYALRKPQSLLLTQSRDQEAEYEAEFASPLDACVPSVMEILVAELFQGITSIGEAAEATTDCMKRGPAQKSKMKEARASGGRSLDSIELLARSLPFLPNPGIHEVIGAILKRFQATDGGAQATAALEEALKRVAYGLAKNPSVELSYMFLYVYNVLNSSLESLRPLSAKEIKLNATDGCNTAFVTSWLVSEKSAAATKLLAKRTSARETSHIMVQQQMTGFDKMRQQQQNKTKQQKREAIATLVAESTTHIRELLSYGIFLMFSFLRKSGNLKDQNVENDTSVNVPAQLIDPLVPLLLRCTGESKNDRAVINALKCLSSLLPRVEELPALQIARSPLLDRIFTILQQAGAATRNEMVQTCYRTLTALLRQQQRLELVEKGSAAKKSKADNLRLTEPQLRVLLSFLRADLDEQDHQNATFALLKAIVNSHLVVSEVYDVMLRVGELLVQSDSPSARLNCATIYQTFLLEYPLGAKRLSRHFKFLVDNLNYGHTSGRSAVLEAIRSLLVKIPKDLVNERSQYFFLPLVLRLANDETSECRDLARTALTTLVRRLGNKELNESIMLVGKWWKQASNSDGAEAVKLLGAAAQVTTLVLETRPEFFERSAFQVLHAARSALERLQRELQTVKESNQVRWQPTYHVCVTLIAFSEHLAGPYELWLETAKPSENFLDAVVLPLLQYPHAWVRLSITRLLTSYLRRRQSSTLGYAVPVKRLSKDDLQRLQNGALYLQRPGRLFTWASSLCKLLEASSLNEELVNEIITALLFLAEALEITNIPQDVTAAAVAALNNVNELVDGEFTANNIDDGDKTTGEKQNAETQLRESQKKSDEQKKSSTPMVWLLTRLSFSARDSNCTNEVQKIVFKLFAALLHNHDATFAQRYVLQIINPLYRATSTLDMLRAQQEQAILQREQTRHKKRRSGPTPQPVAPPESALLAQEVMHLLEKKLGAKSFLEAYSLVQRKMAARRAVRKLQLQTEAVSNPQRAAQRRIQKNEQKRQSKQMRKRKYAVLKGSTSAAVRPTKVLRPGAE